MTDELFEAAKNGTAEDVAFFYGKGVLLDGIHSWDDYGRTPLAVAVFHGNTEFVRALLSFGADPDVRDGDGDSAVEYAVRCRFYETLFALLEHGSEEARARRAEEALRLAATYGRVALVKMLLERGVAADAPETKWPQGDTPLLNAVGGNYGASERERLKMVKVLLKHGASNHSRNSHGMTPLREAAERGFTRIALRLQKVGAKLDLFEASLLGDTVAVATLLDAGAEVNAHDPRQRTALYHAASHGHADTVSLLLERAADFTLTDEYGHTPLLGAVQNGHLCATERLLQAGAMAPGALTLAADSSQAELVTLLLTWGADINERGDQGEKTPLIAAVGNRSVEGIARLLAAGADVNATNDYGYTALLVASESVQDLETIQFLLEAGADVNQRNVHGFTALHYALINGLDTIADLLRAAGAQE